MKQREGLICDFCGDPIENLENPHFHVDPATGRMFLAIDHVRNSQEDQGRSPD